MAKFKEGVSGNPKGRPKGSGSIKSFPIRNQLAKWANESTEKLLTELDKLEGRQFVAAYLEVIEYVLPKLQRKEPTFDLSGMTEEEIEHLLKLIEARNENV